MIKAILFDLDGTLLPMDQDKFTAKYFDALARHHAKYGYDPKKLVDAVWKGTVAMLKNDGSATNEQAFWTTFEQVTGESAKSALPKFDEFYASGFDDVKSVCGFEPKSAQVIAAAKTVGVPLVLASNPIFPVEAQIKRAEWAGANVSDFSYITSYGNSRYCKPNPMYYQEIADSLGCKPDECLMIGNDTSDDLAASKIGMRVFIITDCLINKKGVDITELLHGNVDRLIEYLMLQGFKRQ